MEIYSNSRRLASEFIGTALLLATVVGSGIMGDRLAGGNVAIALLANTVATGAILVVLITVFGPISGAHFNPAVSLIFCIRRRISPRTLFAYFVAQVMGGVVGVFAAHAMFAESVIQVSTKLRDGSALAWSEFIATFGLLATILGVSRFKPEFTPVAVGLYITSAYWFTASTSFANPAVTIARSLTDSFAGIAPASVIPFVIAQILGALIASYAFKWLLQESRHE